MAFSGSSTGNQDWATFYKEHRRALVAYALSLTGDAAEAEDLLHDVLVSAARVDRGITNRKAYCLKAIRHRAMDRWRAIANRPAIEPIGVAHVAMIDSTAGNAASRAAAEQVRSALGALPIAYYEVVVLKVYCGQTFREIAEVLDRPMGTVTVQYRRAIEQMKRLLTEEPNRV
jgi:RNA polymerase sigma-70 factor (ECF subfamily)